MEHNIDGNPDYGHLTVSLNRGEKFIAKGGAMAWMSEGMNVKARLLSGKVSAFIRKLVGGDSPCSSASSATTRADKTLSRRPSLARSAIERCLAIRLS